MNKSWCEVFWKNNFQLNRTLNIPCDHIRTDRLILQATAGLLIILEDGVKIIDISTNLHERGTVAGDGQGVRTSRSPSTISVGRRHESTTLWGCACSSYVQIPHSSLSFSLLPTIFYFYRDNTTASPGFLLPGFSQ